MARSVGLVAASVSTLIAFSAHADQSLHATGTITTGFSNNITNTPETEDAQVIADGFATIAPGALFSYESPRFSVEAAYILNARLFFRERSANSFSNALSARGSLAVSALDKLEGSISGSAGRINAFDTLPDEGDIDLPPTGDIAYARLLAAEAFTRQLSYLWRIRQTADASAFTPTDETTNVNTNWNVGGSLALERAWQRHQVTGSFEGKYVHNERIDVDSGDRLAPDLQVIAGPRVRWLWDISGTLSSSVTLGLVRVFEPDSFSTGIYQPNLAAQLAYFKHRSILTLRYLHGVNTNTLIGQTSTVDRGELRGYFPTPEILEDSGLTGTVGYQRAKFIDVDSESLAASSKQALGDVAATWRQYEGLTWAVRYQYSRGTRGVAAIGSTQETSRHQVQLMLTVRYPERQAVELPRRIIDRVDESNPTEDLEAQQQRR